MKFDLDDPKLTAYVLGELDDCSNRTPKREPSSKRFATRRNCSKPNWQARSPLACRTINVKSSRPRPRRSTDERARLR